MKKLSLILLLSVLSGNIFVAYGQLIKDFNDYSSFYRFNISPDGKYIVDFDEKFKVWSTEAHQLIKPLSVYSNGYDIKRGYFSKDSRFYIWDYAASYIYNFETRKMNQLLMNKARPAFDGLSIIGVHRPEGTKEYQFLKLPAGATNTEQGKVEMLVSHKSFIWESPSVIEVKPDHYMYHQNDERTKPLELFFQKKGEKKPYTIISISSNQPDHFIVSPDAKYLIGDNGFNLITIDGELPVLSTSYNGSQLAATKGRIQWGLDTLFVLTDVERKAFSLQTGDLIYSKPLVSNSSGPFVKADLSDDFTKGIFVDKDGEMIYVNFVSGEQSPIKKSGLDVVKYYLKKGDKTRAVDILTRVFKIYPKPNKNQVLEDPDFEPLKDTQIWADLVSDKVYDEYEMMIISAETFWKEGNKEAALELYTKAIALNRTPSVAFAGRALILSEDPSTYAQAADDADICINKDDENINCRFVKAKIHIANARWQDAVYHYSHIVKIDPSLDGLHFTIVKLAARMKQADLANSIIEKHIDYVKHMDSAWVSWATVHRKMGRNDLAYNDYMEAYKLSPRKEYITYALDGLITDRRFNKVKEFVDELIKKEPFNSEAYYYLALAEEGYGNKEESCVAAQRSASLGYYYAGQVTTRVCAAGGTSHPDPDQCPVCKGTGGNAISSTCSVCHGKGVQICTKCHGKRYVYNINGQSSYCDRCSGTGGSTCYKCYGTRSQTTGKKCATCNGSGRKK